MNLPANSTLRHEVHEALTNPDFRKCRHLAQQLPSLLEDQQAEVLALLVQGLGASRSLEQRRAAQLLGVLGERGQEAIPALIPQLKAAMWTVREAVVLALHQMQARSDAVLTALVERTLHDREALVRTVASRALKSLDLQGERLDCLFDATQHGLPRIRIRALRALGEYPERAGEVVPLVMKRLDDSHAKVRFTAIEMLAGFGGDALGAIPLLLRRWYDHDQRTHAAAQGTLLTLRGHMPAPHASWLAVSMGEEASEHSDAEENLLVLLRTANLPGFILASFQAVCRRRTQWHRRRLRQEAEGVADTSKGELMEVLAAAGGDRIVGEERNRSERQKRERNQEAVWLLAWLWGELVEDLGSNP